jgi:hypothetical protein
MQLILDLNFNAFDMAKKIYQFLSLHYHSRLSPQKNIFKTFNKHCKTLILLLLSLLLLLFINYFIYFILWAKAQKQIKIKHFSFYMYIVQS